jgi:hypothetical protein
VYAPSDRCLDIFLLQYTAHTVAKEKHLPLDGITFDVAGTFDVRGYLGVGDAPPYLQKVKLHANVKTSADEVRRNC